MTMKTYALAAMLILFTSTANAQIIESHSVGRLVTTADTDFDAAWHPLAIAHIDDIRKGDVYLITANTEAVCQCEPLGYKYTLAIASSSVRPTTIYRDVDLPEIDARIFLDAYGSATVSGYGDGAVTRSQSYLFEAEKDRPDGLYIFAMARGSGAHGILRLQTSNDYVQIYKLAPQNLQPSPPGPGPTPHDDTLTGMVLELQATVQKISGDVARLQKRVRRLAR